ncbi:MAG: SDR family oxidoreductase [Pseudotabrizicola sp.]|uniref:SDR family NAD(P)-dependent oxidoreductase n=1 Tax=Pseudotabrizicola sp. TaxID=2939647 RepID=UPI00271C0BAA|nr:SDR family oxidoreductase [Pseudotabrizicola sp.]MDO8882104.1 SDR family oxidoreductase [Pseudotabrizicola sp.]MDP2083044.1 SDR family oxidoreductase [Pseudotabrizicola sp.]MDZ7572462.1 SDR family oxidoreductase [Pseudotabrizicola sp.]
MSVAIVTGAGSGIGRAIAERLVADGYKVLVNDFRAEAAAEVAAGLGASAHGIGGDVSDESDVAAMVAAAETAFGPVTHLVNNAGHVHQGRFLDLTVADFDRMIAVHLRGSFLCTHAVLRGMLDRGAGVIVNVASQLGQIGGVELVHYSAAKAGIIGLTKALAREVSAQGVRVNAVAPGPINTPLVRSLSEDWQRAKAATLPLGRFGEAEEVAATVAFLCSPAASLFVGQTLGPNSGDVML